MPAHLAGGALTVYANAVSTSNIADTTGARLSFTANPGSSAPHLVVSPSIVAPGGGFTAVAKAFAPGETVTFSLAGTTLGSGVAGPGGNTPAVALTVPVKQAFGPTSRGRHGHDIRRDDQRDRRP